MHELIAKGRVALEKISITVKQKHSNKFTLKVSQKDCIYTNYKTQTKTNKKLAGRTVYIDGVQMPAEGWQVDEFGFTDNIR